MASASTLLSEDPYLCSICLDVFTDPVTIPCGHNFCKSCITQHWDCNIKSQCPLCNKCFDRPPELNINLFISEMAAQFKQSTLKRANWSSVQKYVHSGDVLCDVCTDTKLKALKSCLVCLASYCETHLEPHHRIQGLKRHELINPVENLEDRMCQKHDRPLEVFCRTDRMCVCQFCTESDHKTHVIVPLVEEYGIQRAELGQMEAEVQQLIQERQLKIEGIKQSVKLSRADADRETAASVQLFTALVQSVERGLAQLIDLIQEQQKSTEKQAEVFIRELEEEISELKKRHAEVEQLSHTEDPLILLQNLPALNTAPPSKDWTEVRVHSSYEGTVRRAVAQLEETLSEEMRKLQADVELKRVRQYAVEVTLDPDSAHPALILSDDGKRVSCGDVKRNLPDNPKRFTSSHCVLGQQGFSSGTFYYEVEVKGKTKWDLGVAQESITRKGPVAASPSVGVWIICLRHGSEYRARDQVGVCLSLKSKPERVGVFVDFEEDLVSFYDVDTGVLIYSFTGCKFTGKICPFFSPGVKDGGQNCAPLVLSPAGRSS